MTCLHDYNIIYNSIEATVEVCTKCHNKLATRKGINGEYDYKTYYHEHRRDFLQPYMKEYHKEYGNSTTEKSS